MRKANFKGKCVKLHLDKCKAVCRTYDDIQLKYAQLLQENDDIVEIRCNVLLEGLTEGNYTSDFVCTKANLANANMNNVRFVKSVFNFTSFNIFNSFCNVHCHSSTFWVWH